MDLSSERNYILTPEITLPKGMYTMTAQYECSGGDVGVTIDMQYANGEYDANVSGTVSIGKSDSVSCDFKIKYDNRPVQVRGRMTSDAGEGDYILIRNISIVSSDAGMRNALFYVFVFFFLADLLVLLYFMRDRIHIDTETMTNLKIMILLTAFSSIPLMVDFIWSNALDIRFHLMRIEGLKEGLESGMFPVKIQPNWMNGHGYAVSVFYGDVLLYIPALLRMFGVSLQASYQLYILFINMCTVFIAYYCFSKMSSKKIGLVCAFIYSLNIFRLYDIYTRAAVGEYTAIAFIPLVLYGIWCVYRMPSDTDGHKKAWIPICLGCTGIFQSHIITTELVAAFVLLTVLVFWKKTFQKENLAVFLKAAAATVCLNLWFLVPFLDYMTGGTYVVNNPAGYIEYKLEGRGTHLAQIFMTEYSVMKGNRDASLGTADDMPRTIGMAALAVLAVWFVFYANEKRRSKAERKEEYFAISGAVLSIWMATCLFPYTWFAKHIPILKLPISSIQYSWRFFVISAAMIVYLLCIMLREQWTGRKKKMWIAGVLVCISLLQSISYMSSVLNESHTWRIYQGSGLDSFDIIFGEYIPFDWEDEINLGEYKKAYKDELTYNETAVSLEEWHRENYEVLVSLTNNTQEIQQVEVPLLLYKGYHAVTDSGEELSLSPGTSYRISVSVPAGFSGSFKVGFEEPWYWRVCEAISLLALAGIVFCTINRRAKRDSVGTIS